MSVTSTSSSDEPYVAMEVKDDWKPYKDYDHSPYLTEEDHQTLLYSTDEVEPYIPKYMPDDWKVKNGLDDNDIFHPVDDEWLVDLEIQVYHLALKAREEWNQRRSATKQKRNKTSDVNPNKKKKMRLA